MKTEKITKNHYMPDTTQIKEQFGVTKQQAVFLIAYLGDENSLKKTSFEKLIRVPTIGEITAKKIVDYYKKKK